MVCIHMEENGSVTSVAEINEAHKFRYAINANVFPITPLNCYYESVRQAEASIWILLKKPNSPGFCWGLKKSKGFCRVKNWGR